MDIFLKIDLNLFAFIICLGMYIVSFKTSEKYMIQNRLFRFLILTTMLLLLLEMAGWFVDGHPGEFLYIINYLFETLGFMLTPVPALLWALYANYQIFNDIRRLKFEALLLSIPIVLFAMLAVSSFFTGLVFYIDSSNVYHRGPLFLLAAIVAYLQILYITIVYIFNRKKIEKKLLIPMLLFAVPPVVGAALQMMYFGATLLWSSITLSIFIVYTSVQNQQFYLDHLTGVFNRRQLDNYLYNRIQSAAKGGKLFSCIMLDIDNFKFINDNYGHVVGDEALTAATAILRSCIRNVDFLARYAGDEFVIILDISDLTLLKNTVERIHEKAAEYNQTSEKPFTISFSAGYDIYHHEESMTRDSFISRVDALMYAEKNRKKAAMDAAEQSLSF